MKSIVRFLAVSLFAAASGFAATDPADPGRAPHGLDSGEWSSLRAAYEANRHAAIAVDGAFAARITAQHWRTRFDGRGVTVAPDTGGWTWGLELASYGFPGREVPVTAPAAVHADGARVTYRWDSLLDEWFVNDRRGLEHGFTLRERPVAHGPGPLAFRIDVRGGLAPVVTSDGRGVDFVGEHGATVLRYLGLVVTDADGRDLPARLALAGDQLVLTVDEHGARYPVTIDPIAQQAYLKASNPEAGDSFGNSVAISGDTVVIGAPWEDSSATGANGDSLNNGALDSGAVYVFVRNGGAWTQQAHLKASNTDPNDSFGLTVAIDGDTIVVGAIGESSGATGVNGNEGNNSASGSGAAYVFVRSGTTWTQQAYLKASNTGAFDYFGYSVAIAADTVVVGAVYEASAATGVGGNQTNNLAADAGAAYVFVRNGATWSQQAYLKASNTNSGDFFGDAVAIAGDTIVIGAGGENSTATGVNGNQFSEAALDSGAAYVFVRNGATWSQQAYLKASNTEAIDFFGQTVAIAGDVALVGAYNEASDADGVNGDATDNSLYSAGAVYLFVRNGASWSAQAYLKASNSDSGDVFGWSIAIEGDDVVLGAFGEASGSAGVGANQADNSAPNAGAAYVLAVPCGAFSDYGAGCAGTGGFVPQITASGCATGNGTVTLSISQGLGGAPILLVVGAAQAALAVGSGCTLLVQPLTVVDGLALLGSGAGNGSLAVVAAIPASALAGPITVQVAVADPTVGIQYSLSNGLQIDLE